MRPGQRVRLADSNEAHRAHGVVLSLCRRSGMIQVRWINVWTGKPMVGERFFYDPRSLRLL